MGEHSEGQEEHMKHVGELIRRLRGRIELTQEELAEKAGVSPTTVVRLERGEIRQPRAGTLKKLAGALGIDAGELLWFWPDQIPGLVEPGEVGWFTAVFQHDGDWW